MASDIILDDESIRLEGPTIDVHGHTLILDFILPRDTSLNMDDLRRPLVHDGGDSLTINWREKYTGGVNIFGAVTIPGTLSVKGRVLVNIKDKLGGVDAPPPDGRRPLPPVVEVDPFTALDSPTPEVDLKTEIRMVRDLLRNLNERVKAMETR